MSVGRPLLLNDDHKACAPFRCAPFWTSARKEAAAGSQAVDSNLFSMVSWIGPVARYRTSGKQVVGCLARRTINGAMVAPDRNVAWASASAGFSLVVGHTCRIPRQPCRYARERPSEQPYAR